MYNKDETISFSVTLGTDNVNLEFHVDQSKQDELVNYLINASSKSDLAQTEQYLIDRLNRLKNKILND